MYNNYQKANFKMKTSVEQLLLQPFSNRTYEDRLRILRDGKPLDIKLLIKTSGNIDITISNVEWLTRCAEGFRLFCWPCLLFAKFVGIWNNTGYTDVFHLNEETQKHELEMSHILYHMRLKNVLRLINNKPAPSKPSAIVLRCNKYKAKMISCILRGIVDIVCSPEKRNRAAGVPESLERLVKRDTVKKKAKRTKHHKTNRSEFKIVPIESLIPTLSQSNFDSENDISSESIDHEMSSDDGKNSTEKITSIKQEVIHDSYMQETLHVKKNDLPEESGVASHVFECPPIKHEALNIDFDGDQPG